MTHDEMIAVIRAHKEGKPIQSKLKDEEYRDDWEDCLNIGWNFKELDYRVKPEPHYRPFKSTEEVMEAIKEHGDWLITSIDKSECSSIIKYCTHGFWKLSYYNSEIEYVSFETALTNYPFTDGTPFGIKED